MRGDMGSALHSNGRPGAVRPLICALQDYNPSGFQVPAKSNQSQAAGMLVVVTVVNKLDKVLQKRTALYSYFSQPAVSNAVLNAGLAELRLSLDQVLLPKLNLSSSSIALTAGV